ncbi:MAG: hypothetical protein IPH32_09050 [Bacteroidetes bacterium]|nr:hypothetical protein [Bacteroidota bacterium]
MTKSISENKFIMSYNQVGYYELSIKDNVEIFVDDIHLIVNTQKQLNGSKSPILIFGGQYSTTNTETLKYISVNENMPFSKCAAFIVSSISQKLLGNFYLKIYKPQRPTRFFNHKEDAINWLKQYL